MKDWKTLSKDILLECNKFLKVENHTIELPDGRIIRDWPWIITPDFINVVALTEEGRFICFRQTKYAIKGTSLAPVGGYINPGEAPLAAAQRELLEETGYSASQWHPLGSFPVDSNRGCGNGHYFLALGARATAQPVQDDLEEQELLFLTRQEMDAAIGNGAFRVLTWATAVLLALRFLDQERS